MTTYKSNSLKNEGSPETSVAENGGRTKQGNQVTKRPRCKLDREGRINLQDILLSFNGPINQEQAWALCYQTAKSMSRFLDNKFCQLTELSQIFLHKDGDVWLGNLHDTRHPCVSEQEAVFSLGMIVFKALDFGLDQEEERPLSPDLESLITLMTSPNEEYEGDTEERLQETDDEGIEQDSGDGDTDEFSLQKTNESYEKKLSVCSLKNVLKICTKHIQSTNEFAETHYRAVIRAFVAEALELSQFLEKVAAEKQHLTCKDSCGGDGTRRGSASHHNLDTLDFNDWARFWVQVIGELRRGVKLKKVEANLNSRGSSRGRGKGAEYELTPYEILMDDIRERRYHLRKTPSPSPHLRKDAHAVILEFIRSRPPLKKASERQLPPLQTESTLRELLMESIKKPPKPLRPSTHRRRVSTVKEVHSNDDLASNEGEHKENSSPTVAPKPPRRDLDLNPKQRPRKLIPVDFDLKLDADEDDDDDYNEDFAVTRFEEDEEDWHLDKDDPRNQEKDDDESDSANPWRSTGGLRLTRNEYHRFCDTQLESYDLATQCPTRRASARKHAARRNMALAALTGTTSLPHSRPQSRQQASVTGSTLSPGPSPNISLNPSPSLSPQPRARKPQRAYTVADAKDGQEQTAEWQDDGEQKPSLGDMFLDERLSLTLEEIVHIRSVLTKAELESLPVEGRVKEDVEKRRVCFLCLKTRFGIIGPWGQRCRLCERTVCRKCYSKMRIPTEHFAHVPVVLLSPGLLLSPSSSEPDTGGKNSWLRGPSAVGSAPASPASRRKDSALRSLTPSSTPTTTPVSMPTPSSTSPAHLRRETDHLMEKRLYKGTGSPAALSTTKTFSTSSGPSSEQRLAAERLRGVAMVVCHDCRIMVIQIIKSSRTTRATIRNNVISRLTLNLSPAYV